MQAVLILKLLILLTVANGAPVMAKNAFGRRFALPLDLGRNFFDGRRLLGDSKTFRGLAAALVATPMAAALVGLDWREGAVIAVFAMAGDVLSSFVKRRLDLPSSARATGLDQIPESLLPLLAVRGALMLSAADVIAGTALFFVGELLLSRVAYKYRLRDRPY
jgi:CDP-2,3-bis-(O-geranylgeranyl)-sn-glycerol synthase